MNEHWLYRPRTVSILRIWGIALLVVIVLAELFVSVYTQFDFANWFAFHALYGFASCVVLVLIASALGRLLRRDAHYYQPDEPARETSREESGA